MTPALIAFTVSTSSMHRDKLRSQGPVTTVSHILKFQSQQTLGICHFLAIMARRNFSSSSHRDALRSHYARLAIRTRGYGACYRFTVVHQSQPGRAPVQRRPRSPLCLHTFRTCKCHIGETSAADRSSLPVHFSTHVHLFTARTRAPTFQVRVYAAFSVSTLILLCSLRDGGAAWCIYCGVE